MVSLTWKQVWARRLARHCLLNRAPSEPEGLVRTVGAVCGIQAQVMPAAELSVGIRVDGVTRNDVQAALWENRTLVKTYGIRGTIHLFPSDELPLKFGRLRLRSWRRSLDLCLTVCHGKAEPFRTVWRQSRETSFDCGFSGGVLI